MQDEPREAFDTATDMIERYGDVAASIANANYNRAQEQGDIHAARRWWQVRQIIERLQDERPQEREEN
jgi:hypothetical protein